MIDFIYGTAWKEEQTAELTEAAVRAGFRAIDTANQRKHYFEAKAGEGLRAVYRAGVVSRADLFLQTKYTYLIGQDHRLPYDPKAPLAMQVAQSLESSLENLGTDHVDSFLLHGPAAAYGWSEHDQEVWGAMLTEKDSGRARAVGVSNVSLRHLEGMIELGAGLPQFVQNRCFARMRWDIGVRRFCAAHGIVYQGFSLLTANEPVVSHPVVTGIARKHGATNAQIIFQFARRIGILPLTGTASTEHMQQDLRSRSLELSDDDVAAIEGLG